MNFKALENISYGMYMLSSKKNDKINGQIVNSCFQIAPTPPTIATAINKNNLTHDFIEESKLFCISILPDDFPLKLIGKFGFKSGREINKFENIEYKLTERGLPYLKNSLGFIECKVINSIFVNAFSIFIGEVIACDILNTGKPMTYSYYHEIKGGGISKNAPDYIKKEEKNNMEKYKCTVCNYIYDPENGDSENGIKPRTPFEELPDDWTCPVCGVDKSLFEKEK
jgi:flavin reductase (DIM6/NTAB) family NADH-FMN oxidoreductase RutF/rubredoxin